MGPSGPESSLLARLPIRRVCALVGPFGSGKTEIAVNLALLLAAEGLDPALADLDVVNPYFRSREARATLEAKGVRVFAPPPEMGFADLPVLAPGVGALLVDVRPVVLDAGGDAAGARVLRLFASALRTVEHDILFVVNACRPYARTPETAFLALRAWEETAGLAVTGVVANAHMLEETSREVVEHGLAVARETAALAGVRVAFAGMTASIRAEIGVPVLSIVRHMLPPHQRRAACRV